MPERRWLVVRVVLRQALEGCRPAGGPERQHVLGGHQRLEGQLLTTLHEVECAFDTTTLDGGGRRARLAFHAVAGTRYFFQVSSQFGEAPGQIKLVLKKTDVPPNDAFGSAKAITVPFSKTVSNVRATTQPGEPEHGWCQGTRGTLWYRVRVPHTATLRADTFGSAPDTVLAVYSGGPSISSLHVVACNDQTSFGGSGVSQSSVAWRAKANKTYWVQLGGYLNSWGSMSLHVRKVSSPSNDDRGAATHIPSLDGGAFTQSASSRNATWQPGETVVSRCTNQAREHATDPLQSIWYRYTAESTDPLEFIAEADNGVWPVVLVYTGGSFATQDVIACRAVGGDAHTTDVTFSPLNGETLWIQVAGEYGSGPIRVSLNYAPEP